MLEVIGNNSQAFKFRADDADDLVRVLKNILKMRRSDAKALVENEYKYVASERSWTAMAYNYKQMYRLLVESK